MIRNIPLLGPQEAPAADKFPDLASFQAAGGAATYGDGPVWIGGVQYWCDGVTISAIGGGNSGLTVDSVNVFTASQRGNIVTLNILAGVVTPDFSSGNFFSINVTENFTLATPINLPLAGITQSGSIFLTQDAVGGKTIIFSPDYVWTGGVAQTLSTQPNIIDRLDYVIGPNGKIHVSLAKDVK